MMIRSNANRILHWLKREIGGSQPTVELEEGLKRMIEYFKNV